MKYIFVFIMEALLHAQNSTNTCNITNTGYVCPINACNWIKHDAQRIKSIVIQQMYKNRHSITAYSVR